MRSKHQEKRTRSKGERLNWVLESQIRPVNLNERLKIKEVRNISDVPNSSTPKLNSFLIP